MPGVSAELRVQLKLELALASHKQFIYKRWDTNAETKARQYKTH